MDKEFSRDRAVTQVINGIRSLFHELKVVAQEIHGGSQLAGGRRGVLLNLLEEGDQTVPALASRRPVSRQHIQILVNELLQEELVMRKANPAHKRSMLVSLTKKGRKKIQAMLQREKKLLQSLNLDVTTPELLNAANLLQELGTALRDPAWRQAIREA